VSNRNPRNHQLLSQIPESNPFKKTVAPAFDIPDFLEKDMEAVGLRRDLSSEGKQEKKQGHLRRAIRDWRDIQTPLNKFRAETETMRVTAKKLPAYDKTDIVAAMGRRELRDRSLTMSFGQRAMRMTGPRRDLNFVDAILEFDPWVSGIDVDNPNELEIYETAKTERLRDFHAQLIDQIAERDATELEARMIVDTVRNDLAQDSGLDRREFEAFAKPIETRAGAAWKMEDKKTICEVVNGKPVYHLGSEDELRDAKEYPNLAAYLADRAA
jgi:hypothetical protein